MAEQILGSVELSWQDGRNASHVGVAWTVDTVPLVLGVLDGLTDFAAVEPTAAPTGRVPEAQWTAIDREGQPLTVRLWPDIPFDETAVGQAIAAAMAESDA